LEPYCLSPLLAVTTPSPVGEGLGEGHLNLKARVTNAPSI
jgi:hypothetical protein